MMFIHSRNYLLIPGSPHAPGICDPLAPILLNALKLGKPTPRSPDLCHSLLGAIGPLGTIVRDIDEAYTLSLEHGPTWRIWVPLNARKLSFFCFLALRLVSRVDYTFC
jgi:hypothetical protein